MIRSQAKKLTMCYFLPANPAMSDQMLSLSLIERCQTERPHLPTSQHLQLWRNYSPRWFSCRLCSQLCGLSTGLTVRHVWGWSPPNNSTSTRYWGGFLSVDTATHISQLSRSEVGILKCWQLGTLKSLRYTQITFYLYLQVYKLHKVRKSFQINKRNVSNKYNL